MNISSTNTVTEPQQTSKGNIDAAKKVKLQKAVQEFEALFVSYMLKTMRESVQKADTEGESFGGDLFDDMFNVEVAKAISKQGSFGIAESLYKKITGESLQNVPIDTQSLLQLRASKIRYSKNQNHSSPSGVSTTLNERINRFQSAIDEAAEKHGIDSTLVKAVIAAESAGNPHALSSKRAKGLMQLIDSTAAEMGVENVWDPTDNINGGTKYLKSLLDKFNGDVKLAVASYNAGPERVEKYGDVPPIKETQNYVARVLQLWNAFKEQKGVDHEE